MKKYFQHKEIHKFTWVQYTRQMKSIIDYVLVRQKTKMQVAEVRAHRGPNCSSDSLFT